MKVCKGSKDPAMGLQKWLPCATLEQVITHHEDMVTYKKSLAAMFKVEQEVLHLDLKVSL